MPKVSVIVPNYNHARFLNQRLQSIFNQTFQDFEVILLDDCSADNSLEVLDHYKNHPKVSQFVVNKKNSGSPFKQWEKGIELAKGEFIWIAESDDYCELQFLETLVPVLDTQGNIGIVFSNSNWIDSSGDIKDTLSIYQKSFFKKGLTEIKEELIYRNTIQNVSSVLIRRSILEQSSTEYCKYRACGDWILYVEILNKSDLYFEEKRLNYFRWYHDNTSNKSESKGLWIIEGIDTLSMARKNIIFNYFEKDKITSFWSKRINKLRKSIPCSMKLFILTNLKLFTFSPYHYLKYFFVK